MVSSIDILDEGDTYADHTGRVLIYRLHGRPDAHTEDKKNIRLRTRAYGHKTAPRRNWCPARAFRLQLSDSNFTPVPKEYSIADEEAPVIGREQADRRHHPRLPLASRFKVRQAVQSLR